MGLGGFFGFNGKGKVNKIDRKAACVWQLNLLEINKSAERADWTARVAIGAIDNLIDSDTIKKISTAYRKGEAKIFTITIPQFTTDGDFVWNFSYRHRTKIGQPDITWQEWSERTKLDRSEYRAILVYGVRGREEKDLPLLEIELDENLPEDKEKMKRFLDAFWGLARTCLGVKFDDDEREPVMSLPKDNHGILPEVRIGVPGKKFGFLCGGDLSERSYNELAPDDQPEALDNLIRLRDLLTERIGGLSKLSLNENPSQQQGPEKNDYDLLREAFDWVQTNLPGCREGYADAGKAMISAQEAAGRSTKAILINMKGAGGYDEVIKRFGELKSAPAPAPAPTTPAPAPTPVPTPVAPTVPTGSAVPILATVYAEYHKEYGAHTEAKYPLDWDAEFAADDEYTKARQKNGVLSCLDREYIKINIFQLAERYARESGGAMISVLSNFCQAEATKAIQQKKSAGAV